MKSLYECERCGKVFNDYNECDRHEHTHYETVSYYDTQYSKFCEDQTSYSERQEAPEILAVEMKRWNLVTCCEERVVGLYRLREVFHEDRMTSDEAIRNQEQDD